MHVRAPAAAGTFYPADPAQLESTVATLVRDAAPLERREAPDDALPKALVVPHAGFIYSGATAAAAYSRLRRLRGTIRRVVLLGPAHRVALRGLAIPESLAMSTPLGTIPIARRALDELGDLPQVRRSDHAHALEHSLEVQLPFLQHVLGDFELVPLVVGSATDAEIAEVIERLWGGDETLIVVSSDLSHYYDYSTAKRMDEATCAAIEAMAPERIGEESACGRAPLRGLLCAARSHGLEVHTLDLRNSGDTAGDRAQVVGYGAWSLSRPAEPRTGQAAEREHDLATDDAQLLDLARRAIEHGLEFGVPPSIDAGGLAAALREPGACFVTLRSPDGALRGCIGSLQATRLLAEDVVHNAFAAAFRDPRMKPVSAAELQSLRVELSLLGPLERIAATSFEDLVSKLRPGRDGLVLEDAGQRGTLLPQVWSDLPSPKEFAGTVWKKAGLPPTHWSSTTRAFRYGVRKLGEAERRQDATDPR
jgi:AmmeMemoRadiSam system protein B/AmmeMemoRadiSam system protein A